MTAYSNPGTQQGPVQDFASQLGAALALLEQGKALEARSCFEALTRQDGNRAAGWIGLALACRECGDRKGEDSAVDRAIRLEPSNLWALVLKGDALQASGNRPAAAAFYLNACKLAPPDEHLPPPLRSALQRAREFVAAQSRSIEQTLQGAFAGARHLPDRFRQSLDILLGKKQIYHSSPRYFHYPGLPSIEFHDRASFPWIEGLEAQTSVIREELETLLATGTGFHPYIESRADAPSKSQDGLLDNMDWSACYLMRNGRVQPEMARLCPRTLDAVRQLPLCDLPDRAPSVLFSRLKPGAHIPPHCGLVNTRLIAHLPLIVPEGCDFRVGATTRPWEEGRAWVFDDSIEHEAWNRSRQTRVILLFEVWRPELSPDEQEAIRQLFRIIDEMRGPPDAWDI